MHFSPRYRHQNKKFSNLLQSDVSVHCPNTWIVFFIFGIKSICFNMHQKSAHQNKYLIPWTKLTTLKLVFQQLRRPQPTFFCCSPIEFLNLFSQILAYWNEFMNRGGNVKLLHGCDPHSILPICYNSSKKRV